MLRLENTHPYPWAEKTMSVLRANQLEACEKYLTGLPRYGLFDTACTDAEAESLYACSWLSEEDRLARRYALHSVEKLRAEVLNTFPVECSLLSPREYRLLAKITLLGGTYSLSDWDEADPALGLARRLWCTVEKQSDGIHLSVPHQLCAIMFMLMANQAHQATREKVDQVCNVVDDTLYLLGVTRMDAPCRHLRSLLEADMSDPPIHLLRRMLLTEFDYIPDSDGEPLLIHPGLAEPERLALRTQRSFSLFTMEEEELAAALKSLEVIENPLYEQMVGLLTDATRPEISPEDAAEDLIILAKQDVSFPEMQEVLASQLILLPTPDMLTALKKLRDQVPRWLYLNSSRVQ